MPVIEKWSRSEGTRFFYLEPEYGVEDVEKAFQDVTFVFAEAKKFSGISDSGHR